MVFTFFAWSKLIRQAEDAATGTLLPIARDLGIFTAKILVAIIVVLVLALVAQCGHIKKKWSPL